MIRKKLARSFNRHRPDLAKTVPTLSTIPTGPAGGDLTGYYPDPLVRNYQQTLNTVAAQAVEIANLQDDIDDTNAAIVVVQNEVDALQVLNSGTATLDAAGAAFIPLHTNTNTLVACWTTAMATGYLFVSKGSPGDFFVTSTTGAADAGQGISWISF